MKTFAVAALLLTYTSTAVQAFTFVPASSSISSSSSHCRIGHPLFNSAAAEPEDASAAAEEAAPEEIESEPEEEVVEEDPEIVALKEEIAKFEAELKSKRLTLSDIQDRADDYTESGYMRKVAEMDNYRKMREISTQNNRFSSRAAVVTKVLPVLDELMELEGRFDPEINGYKALRWDFQNALTEKLDMSEYGAEVGDEFNFIRYKAVSEEYSDAFPKDSIISVVKSGLEIKGNVLRPAEVVRSLGKEEAPEEADEETVEETEEE